VRVKKKKITFKVAKPVEKKRDFLSGVKRITWYEKLLAQRVGREILPIWHSPNYLILTQKNGWKK